MWPVAVQREFHAYDGAAAAPLLSVSVMWRRGTRPGRPAIPAIRPASLAARLPDRYLAIYA